MQLQITLIPLFYNDLQNEKFKLLCFSTKDRQFSLNATRIRT